MYIWWKVKPSFIKLHFKNQTKYFGCKLSQVIDPCVPFGKSLLKVIFFKFRPILAMNQCAINLPRIKFPGMKHKQIANQKMDI